MSLATWDYSRIPGVDEGQVEAVAELVRECARDTADEALLLEALGIGRGLLPPERCDTCGYLKRARSHKILCL